MAEQVSYPTYLIDLNMERDGRVVALASFVAHGGGLIPPVGASVRAKDEDGAYWAATVEALEPDIVGSRPDTWIHLLLHLREPRVQVTWTDLPGGCFATPSDA